MLIDRVISLTTAAGVEPVVVQQNDKESRTVRFFVYESSGVPLDMQNKTARIFFRKNGATSQAYEASVAADGWISLTVPEEVTVYPGNGEMQLALVYGSSILHSFTIPFSVRGSLSFMGETESPEDDPMRIAWDTLPGKPDTFPPSAHTHTPAQAGALPANGTAADAAKLGGKLPKYYDRPHNMLDNSRFANPVNQRGQTSYTGSGYNVDRWRTNFSGDTVEVLAGGVKNTVASTTVGWHLHQIIDNGAEWVGKSITAACNAAAITGALYLLISCRNSNDTEIEHVSQKIAAGLNVTSLTVPSGTVYIRIGVYAYATSVAVGDSVTLEWVALYEGEYTAETLPGYVPKGYAAELMECQRYYHLYATQDARPTHGLDCVPHMRLNNPTQGTIDIGDVTYYYNAADL